jgi:methylglutaconyl-CoA hydratase
VSEPLVQRADHGAVAVLTLSRPGKRNALSRALMAQLRDHLDWLALDPHIRAIVLTGEGTVFCAGVDLKEAAEEWGSSEAEQHAVTTLLEFADLIQRVHTMPKPTIAAVNGDALSGGAGLMTACDIAVAAETARIGYSEVLRGLVPAVVMHDLTRIVGSRRARQLLLSGEFISSALACQWGLVNQVTAAERWLPDAIRVGEGFLKSAPLAIAAIKRLLDEDECRLADFRGAAAVSAAVRISEEAQEGIKAFLEKRTPRWAASTQSL